MKKRIALVLGLIALALLAGCAGSGPKRSLDDPLNSLVVGYIDMSDAPTRVDYAWFMQVAPPTDAPYWGAAVKKGMFYNAYMTPGSYQISRFGGSGFFSGEHQYNFSKAGRNETAVRIDKPGIYYVGSYKYQKVKTGFFEQDKFSIEQVNTPSEAELLQRILDDSSTMQNSSWGAKIRARLAQLKK